MEIVSITGWWTGHSFHGVKRLSNEKESFLHRSKGVRPIIPFRFDKEPVFPYNKQFQALSAAR